MDQRLIRTAVLGGPDSLEPVIMPTVYEVAMGLRLTHHGETFWCGTWLGGCGSQIMTKIGRRKVPHFAHYPEMAGKCRRVDLDETSADHLFIYRDLKNWLARQGIAVQPPRLLGTIRQQGACTGLLLHRRDKKRMIAVVIDDSNAEEWKRLYDEFRKSGSPVDWLYSPTSSAGRALARGQGTGLLAMCQYVNGERRLRIGTQVTGGKINWADLANCKVSEYGIVHPAAPPPENERATDQSNRNGISAAPGRVNEDLKKQAEAERHLEAAFDAAKHNDIQLARFLYERAAKVVSEVQNPRADLQRRLQFFKRHVGREPSLEQRVAEMKRRLRANTGPNRRLYRDLKDLLRRLPQDRFATERREFEAYLLVHRPQPPTQSTSNARTTPKPKPRARCSCGWVGKAARFTRHTKLPAFQNKTHRRLR